MEIETPLVRYKRNKCRQEKYNKIYVDLCKCLKLELRGKEWMKYWKINGFVVELGIRMTMLEKVTVFIMNVMRKNIIGFTLMLINNQK